MVAAEGVVESAEGEAAFATSVASLWPSKSNTQIVLSAKDAATLSPPRLHRTSNIPGVPLAVAASCEYDNMTAPVATSQTSTSESYDPLARYRPFGENATE